MDAQPRSREAVRWALENARRESEVTLRTESAVAAALLAGDLKDRALAREAEEILLETLRTLDDGRVAGDALMALSRAESGREEAIRLGVEAYRRIAARRYSETQRSDIVAALMSHGALALDALRTLKNEEQNPGGTASGDPYRPRGRGGRTRGRGPPGARPR